MNSKSGASNVGRPPETSDSSANRTDAEQNAAPQGQKVEPKAKTRLHPFAAAVLRVGRAPATPAADAEPDAGSLPSLKASSAAEDTANCALPDHVPDADGSDRRDSGTDEDSAPTGSSLEAEARGGSIR